jgi:hypothetical protein
VKLFQLRYDSFLFTDVILIKRSQSLKADNRKERLIIPRLTEAKEVITLINTFSYRSSKWLKIQPGQLNCFVSASQQRLQKSSNKDYLNALSRKHTG